MKKVAFQFRERSENDFVNNWSLVVSPQKFIFNRQQIEENAIIEETEPIFQFDVEVSNEEITQSQFIEQIHFHLAQLFCSGFKNENVLILKALKYQC